MNMKSKFWQRGETNIVQTIMVALLIVGAFFIGMLWTKVQIYEKGGLVMGGGLAGNPTPTAAAPTVPTKIEVEGVNKDDWVQGNRNARVALIEYSDLECPFCKTFHPTAMQMVKEYGDKVMWVFRHFPLDQIHSKARPEAIAAECAGKQGGNAKFWAFIDKVYEITPANNGLDPAQLPQIAGQIGINVNTFNTCLSSQATKDLVEADAQSGLKAGVSGTPGNILLDTKTGETLEIPGAVPYATLKATVDSFLASRK